MISSVRQINFASKTLLQITLYKHHSWNVFCVDMIKYFKKCWQKRYLQYNVHGLFFCVSELWLMFLMLGSDCSVLTAGAR